MTEFLNVSMPKGQSFASDALLPADPTVRDIARGLYKLVADLPIISPHGHVDPSMLLANRAFLSPTDLLLYQDHYITRLLHADGVGLEEILKPASFDEGHARNAWQIFADRQHLFQGTASGYWMNMELGALFGIKTGLTSSNAQEVYEQINSKLQSQEFRPQQLLQQFKIDVLATTDSPLDDLKVHDSLNELKISRIAPTFRPDAFIDPSSVGWANRVEQLVALTGSELSLTGLIESLQIRREYFKVHGAFSVDVGAASAYTTILDEADAKLLFARAWANDLSERESLELRGHLVGEMIRMSCDDGLALTLHVGVHRNHSSETHRNFGPDTGHDLPTSAEFVRNLHPVLERYGLNPNLHLILFALDETTWSREIAPLASFYPSVFIGAPWWFLDAPRSAKRFREATVETAGFYRGSGFIDDTRAFMSIPVRHDMARRVDAGVLAEMVAQGQISLDSAQKIAVDLVTQIPRRAFKL